jgi:hypothetical protein
MLLPVQISTLHRIWSGRGLGGAARVVTDLKKEGRWRATGRDLSPRQNRTARILTWSSMSNCRLVDGHFIYPCGMRPRSHHQPNDSTSTRVQSSRWFWAKRGTSFSIHELLQKHSPVTSAFCKDTQVHTSEEAERIQETCNRRKNEVNKWTMDGRIWQLLILGEVFRSES